MPRVSIIIPVYNSEEYLEESVKTVLDQSFEDFEVILVNDQSTDTSPLICDQLTEVDDRVKVIHLNENKGICGARNEGLRMSTGEYVGFCDNDDFFTKDLILDNYETAKQHNADMVKFGRKLVDMDDKENVLREKESNISEANFYSSKNDMLNHFFAIKSKGLLTNVWNGLYKRSIIFEKGIWFDEEMRFGSEDADFSYRFFQASNNLAVNPKSYYIHFRRNEFSTSRKFSKNKIDSMIKAAKTESPIWDKIKQTKVNQLETILAKNNHVINVMMYQGLHENSELSYKERIALLKRMRHLDHLNYDLNKEMSKYIRQNKPKQWLFTMGYYKEQYHFIYWLLFLEHKFKGEKW